MALHCTSLLHKSEAGVVRLSELCYSRGLRPNTSFKVTRRPVTQFAVANWAPFHRAPQLNR